MAKFDFSIAKITIIFVFEISKNFRNTKKNETKRFQKLEPDLIVPLFQVVELFLLIKKGVGLGKVEVIYQLRWFNLETIVLLWSPLNNSFSK